MKIFKSNLKLFKSYFPSYPNSLYYLSIITIVKLLFICQHFLPKVYYTIYTNNIYKLHGFHKLNPSDAVVIIKPGICG